MRLTGCILTTRPLKMKPFRWVQKHLRSKLKPLANTSLATKVGRAEGHQTLGRIKISSSLSRQQLSLTKPQEMTGKKDNRKIINR